MADKSYPDKNEHSMYSDAPSTTVRKYSEVTPSDVTIFAPWFRALRIGVTGDVVVTDIFGNEVTFANVQDGETLPIWGSQVKAATTATDIVAYFG